jgi:hypothetical protein
VTDRQHDVIAMAEEDSMADPQDEGKRDEDKRNMRIMWIASGLIGLLIVGLMLSIGDTTPPRATDVSSQSRAVAPQ